MKHIIFLTLVLLTYIVFNLNVYAESQNNFVYNDSSDHDSKISVGTLLSKRARLEKKYIDMLYKHFENKKRNTPLNIALTEHSRHIKTCFFLTDKDKSLTPKQFSYYKRYIDNFYMTVYNNQTNDLQIAEFKDRHILTSWISNTIRNRINYVAHYDKDGIMKYLSIFDRTKSKKIILFFNSDNDLEYVGYYTNATNPYSGNRLKLYRLLYYPTGELIDMDSKIDNSVPVTTFFNNSTYYGGSGLNKDDAIIINNIYNLDDGISAEYHYLDLIYGIRGIDYKVVNHSFHNINDTIYFDILILEFSDGSTETFYFNISSFYSADETASYDFENNIDNDDSEKERFFNHDFPHPVDKYGLPEDLIHSLY